MAQRRHSPGYPRGRDDRPHHIASIAHHFFDEDRGPDGVQRIAEREIAVASPVRNPLAAWVSAGLARALAHESVILGESPLLVWSASSYLSGGQLQGLDPARDDAPEDSSPRFWKVLREPDADNPAKRGANPAGAAKVMIRHLGSLHGRHLEELEAVHLTSNPAPAELPGGQALVWCLHPGDTGSLAAAYSLGRILALLRPEQVEVLVVDPAWVSKGALSGPSARPGAFLDRCRLLVDAVGVDCKAQVHHLPFGGSSDPGLQARAFRSLALRLFAGEDND